MAWHVPADFWPFSRDFCSHVVKLIQKFVKRFFVRTILRSGFKTVGEERFIDKIRIPSGTRIFSESSFLHTFNIIVVVVVPLKANSAKTKQL